jgi:putative ABC transport system permease protein
MMFGRLLWKLLRGSRGRLAVALVALVSGAAVISALLNLQLDVEHKLAQEFRTLGANLVVSAGAGMETPDAGAAAPELMDEHAVLAAVAGLNSRDVTSAAPFLYFVASANHTQVVVAGTWLSEAEKLNPSWKVSGEWPAPGENEGVCLIGRSVAEALHLAPGSSLELSNQGRTANLNVAEIFESGSDEDSQVFVDLKVAQSLAGEAGRIGLVQMSVTATPEAMAAVEAKLEAALPGYQVRPIRQVTDAEASLLGRIRLLIASMVILILVLTALCVLATMAALAMERREDVGLMKALGGPISRIVSLFLAEVGVLGALGGAIGCVAGVALSVWMGRRVFGAAISPRWEILPLTVALTTAVALAGALPLRLLGKVKPAVILRGE